MTAQQHKSSMSSQHQRQQHHQQASTTPTANGFDNVYNWFSSNLVGLSGIFSGSLSPSATTSTCLMGTFLDSKTHMSARQEVDAHKTMVFGDHAVRRGRGAASDVPEEQERHWGTRDSSASLSPRHNASASSGPSHRGLDRQGGNPGGSASRASRPPAYEVDKEDLLDQHVGYYLRHHPHIHTQHVIVRTQPGVYELDGRETKVEWQHASEPGASGYLVAVDGPLRQPFADYMEMSETNAEYDAQGVGNKSALHSIPKEKRMSFHDQHKMYSRLEAMKVAKEQALVREKAADYVKDGQDVPGDLMLKYKKTIQQKLDPGGRRSAARQKSQEGMHSGRRSKEEPPPEPALPPPRAGGLPPPAAGGLDSHGGQAVQAPVIGVGPVRQGSAQGGSCQWGSYAPSSGLRCSGSQGQQAVGAAGQGLPAAWQDAASSRLVGSGPGAGPMEPGLLGSGPVGLGIGGGREHPPH
mmetsp:Transcript_61836/g.174268  ORF Transcript_61836/g.174268 Transcript_61836/m.174268 type:complete len:467 (+) Transcript_61836:76-1476(+)|eukprot:CAMPEP_0179271194 /NCGR_PEP_ID=MMETSP0797-20121207/31849_1 /TAXON_ID=47934 /ORGANISM="Dinophysis acuminata, Strain DAEP01" /LENGTH=466 /DNA_ID=CAMNT_0020979537 /DNA_START=72 /DNA_END=1472 /DNA_ORIENTATION=-